MTHLITNLVVSFASIFLDQGLSPQPIAGKLLPAAARCPGAASDNQELAQASMQCPSARQYGADFDCGYGWVSYPDLYGYDDYSAETTEEIAIESSSPFQVVNEEAALDYMFEETNPFRIVSVEPTLADEIALADLSMLCDNLSDTGRAFVNAADIAADRLVEMAASAISREPSTQSLAATAIAELKQMTVALLTKAEAESAPRLRIMRRVCRNVPAGRLVPRLMITSATCRNVPALAFKAVEPRIIDADESPFVIIHQPRSARVAASVPAIPAGEFEPTLRISRPILSRAVVPAIPSGEYRGCQDVARMARAGTVACTQLRITAIAAEASPFALVQEVTVHVAASSASPFSPFIEVISDRQIAGAESQDADAELSDEAVEEVSDAADAISAETDSAAVSSEGVFVASRIQSLSKAILSAVSDTLGRGRATADQDMDAEAGQE